MKTYIDRRGWEYRVQHGIGDPCFRGFFKKPTASGWHGITALPWRDTEAAAQADLDAMAKKKGWKEAEQ